MFTGGEQTDRTPLWPILGPEGGKKNLSWGGGEVMDG